MSTRRIWVFPAWVMTFIIIIFGSFPCVGCLTDEDLTAEEQARFFKHRPSLPPMPTLQSVVDEFAHVTLSKPFESRPIIEALLIVFLRKQGFVVPDSSRGDTSTLIAKEASFAHRVIKVSAQVAKISPLSSADPLSTYAGIMGTPAFGKLIGDEAYIILLENWRKRMRRESAEFPPEASLKQGMLVFCPHPQDVDITWNFLNLLYAALNTLREIEKTPFIPTHQGLTPIFTVFEKHRSNKEEVLNRWGAFLLRHIKEFYIQQQAFLSWTHIAQALEQVNRALLNEDLKLNAVQPQEQRHREHKKFLRQELERVAASYKVAEYFKSPTQEQNVWDLILKLCHTTPSTIAAFKGIYATFNAQLEFSAHQVNFTLHEGVTADSAERVTPSPLPIERQLVLKRLENQKKHSKEGALAFATFAREALTKLTQSEVFFMQHALSQVDTPSKIELQRLLEEAKRRTLSTHEQRTLIILQRQLIQREIELSRPTDRLRHLRLHQDCHIFRASTHIFRLRYQIADLSLQYTQLRILLDEEKRAPIPNADTLVRIKALMQQMEALKKVITGIQEDAGKNSALYEEHRQKLYQAVSENPLLVMVDTPFPDFTVSPLDVPAEEVFAEAGSFASSALAPQPPITQQDFVLMTSSTDQGDTASHPRKKHKEAMSAAASPLRASPLLHESSSPMDSRIAQLEEEQAKVRTSLQDVVPDTPAYAVRALSSHLSVLLRFRNLSFLGNPFISSSILREMIVDIFKHEKTESSHQVDATLLKVRTHITTEVGSATGRINALLQEHRATISQVLARNKQTAPDTSVPDRLTSYYAAVEPILIEPIEQATRIFMDHFSETFYRLYETYLRYSATREEMVSSLKALSASTISMSTLGTLDKREQALLTSKVQAVQALKRSSPSPLTAELETIHTALVAMPVQVREIVHKMIRTLPSDIARAP